MPPFLALYTILIDIYSEYAQKIFSNCSPVCLLFLSVGDYGFVEMSGSKVDVFISLQIGEGDLLTKPLMLKYLRTKADIA